MIDSLSAPLHGYGQNLILRYSS